MSEGIYEKAGDYDNWYFTYNGSDKHYCLARDAFGDLWESVNDKDSWSANPWVWALTFRLHHQNIESVFADYTHLDPATSLSRTWPRSIRQGQ